jgi:hypothetical protein
MPDSSLLCETDFARLDNRIVALGQAPGRRGGWCSARSRRRTSSYAFERFAACIGGCALPCFSDHRLSHRLMSAVRWVCSLGPAELQMPFIARSASVKGPTGRRRPMSRLLPHFLPLDQQKRPGRLAVPLRFLPAGCFGVYVRGACAGVAGDRAAPQPRQKRISGELDLLHRARVRSDRSAPRQWPQKAVRQRSLTGGTVHPASSRTIVLTVPVST